MTKLFGTDGVRGIANTELTSDLAYKLGRAAAHILTKGDKKAKVLVGMDTRVSGDMLESALTAGLLSVGVDVVTIGIVPTPAVSYLVKELNADAGVVISASHNPVEYNGIKFFDGNGYKLSDEVEESIEELIANDLQGVASPVGSDLGKRSVDLEAYKKYVEFSVGNIDGNLEGLKIALDCANGAGYKTGIESLEKLGAEVIAIHNNPDGTNINANCGSTHPEDLMKFVVENNCDLGLAFDGDADRCLAVDEKGNLINGDIIMAICAKDLKEKNKLNDDTLVVTVMSNMGLFIALDKLGIKTVKTKVGDRYVLEEMKKEGFNLGGEQSGHIIFSDYNTTGDGLATGLQLASIVKQSGEALSELSKVMTELPQVLINAKVTEAKKSIYTTDEEIKEEIKKAEETLAGKGRVLIRPSGTEPLVRVMLEGENQKEIQTIASKVANLIETKANS